jgi:hypothetical protein
LIGSKKGTEKTKEGKVRGEGVGVRARKEIRREGGRNKRKED